MNLEGRLELGGSLIDKCFVRGSFEERRIVVVVVQGDFQRYDSAVPVTVIICGLKSSVDFCSNCIRMHIIMGSVVHTYCCMFVAPEVDIKSTKMTNLPCN